MHYYDNYSGHYCPHDYLHLPSLLSGWIKIAVGLLLFPTLAVVFGFAVTVTMESSIGFLFIVPILLMGLVFVGAGSYELIQAKRYQDLKPGEYDYVTGAYRPINVQTIKRGYQNNHNILQSNQIEQPDNAGRELDINSMPDASSLNNYLP